MNQLERAFFEAVCDTSGDSATCQCGREYPNIHTDSIPATELESYLASHPPVPIRSGIFAGQSVVYGCPCDVASRWGNHLWSHRHQIAAFLHGMSAALDADRARLLDVLPRNGSEVAT